MAMAENLAIVDRSIKVFPHLYRPNHNERTLAMNNPSSISKYVGFQQIGRSPSHGACVGGVATSEYYAWRSMKKRCANPKTKNYHIYGGRGIRVCDHWFNSFENFLADMGAKPTPNHSLDRIDVNGNYEPSNCRWATYKEQANNRRLGYWGKNYYQDKRSGSWVAESNYKGETFYIGTFKSEDAAKIAVKAWKIAKLRSVGRKK